MKKPLIKSAIIINLNSCSNGCVFCNPKGTKRVVPPDELRQIGANLKKQALDLKKLKLDRFVEISGTDPIEYKGIVGLIRYLKKDLRFKTICLATHGRPLHDARLVRRLKAAGLDELRIPLYGSTEAVHDSVTQKKGSFRETVQGLRNAFRYAPNIKVTITSLIMKQNVNDIGHIFSLAQLYGSGFSLSIPCIPDVKMRRRFAVSLPAIRPHVVQFWRFAGKTSTPFVITDIPYCIFGFAADNIKNITGPPVTGAHYSIPAPFRSGVFKLPSYRIKTKFPMCARCGVNHKCGGFYGGYLKLLEPSALRPLPFS